MPLFGVPSFFNPGAGATEFTFKTRGGPSRGQGGGGPGGGEKSPFLWGGNLVQSYQGGAAPGAAGATPAGLGDVPPVVRRGAPSVLRE